MLPRVANSGQFAKTRLAMDLRSTFGEGRPWGKLSEAIEEASGYVNVLRTPFCLVGSDYAYSKDIHMHSHPAPVCRVSAVAGFLCWQGTWPGGRLRSSFFTLHTSKWFSWFAFHRSGALSVANSVTSIPCTD